MSGRDNVARKNDGKNAGGNDFRIASPSSGANDLMGLFAPPPPAPRQQTLPQTLFVPPPSETDPLVPSSSIFRNPGASVTTMTPNAKGSTQNLDGGFPVEGLKGVDGTTEDLATTVRRVNSNLGINQDEPFIEKHDCFPKPVPLYERGCSGGGGREFFLKTAAAAAAASTQKQSREPTVNGAITKGSSRLATAYPSRSSAAILAMARSILTSFASPSTWMGGILFVFYHVVFCMANGGSITRPYSGSTTSIMGDMARYTALGIIVSCPFLVFVLGDREGVRTGIPAMYPSADLFLAPFLAEAAAIIDKTIMDDWNSGLLVNNNNDGEDDDELFLTKIWFGSFALVISFGMIAAGSLLILASRIKLANLGTYLPYGVLCGFFSSVGILMWKLAIAIDTPTLRSQGGEETSFRHHWTIVLLHHLPSLVIGLAMNQLGPKHPFFVTGLIILTVVVFYGTMLVLGISLEEAQSNGWFYSHEELHSSISSDNKGGTGSGNDGSWRDTILPPWPFGTWFALFGRTVHWKAVAKGAEHMIALAILYLLRSSIHASALKKNTPNLIRRVPLETKAEDGNGEDGADYKKSASTNDIDVVVDLGDIVANIRSPSQKKHRRNISAASVASMASQLAQSVRDEFMIVNLSLADPQNLVGKCYNSPPTKPSRWTKPLRETSTASTTTDAIQNVASRNNNNNQKVLQSSMKTNIFDENNIENDGDSLMLSTSPREVSDFTQRMGSPSPSDMHPDIRAAQKTKKSSMDYLEINAPATDLTVEDMFVQYGYGLFVTGFCGGFGCCPTIATSNTMYAIGVGQSAPQYFSVFLLLVAFYSSGFELVRYIPKAAFSSLLVLSAADNIVIWFIKPISKMDNLLEWSVVPFIAMFSLLVGFLKAVFLGIGVSTFLFVTDFFRVGVVKYDASGLEIRSRIERSLVQSVWLDTHGDTLRVLVLQNYLFFGNVFSVLRYIETMFEEIPLVESIHLAYPIPPVPAVLVLDLSLITGMDTSAVDVFLDIWRICKSNNCKLYLCGLSPRLKRTFAKGGMKPDTKGPRKFRTLLYFLDLDHGLGRAEDVLIDTSMGDFANQSLFRLKKGNSGFHEALQHIDQLHSTNTADGLLELEPHTAIVTLEKGQILYEKDGGLIKEKDHGLFFIESGMIREDDSRSNRTNTRTGGSFRRGLILEKGNDNTLRGRHARLDTAAQRAALSKLSGGEATHQSNNLRIATAGPGWVVGANEFAMGRHSLKKFKAITKVKMHHLRFSALSKIEKENPALVLRMYKMLTHVMARKEEDTVAHLSTLHDILSSPVHSKPIPRLSIASLPQR